MIPPSEARGTEDHLAKLRLIPGASRWLPCAVEGLHRFYTLTGEVIGTG